MHVPPDTLVHLRHVRLYLQQPCPSLGTAPRGAAYAKVRHRKDRYTVLFLPPVPHQSLIPCGPTDVDRKVLGPHHPELSVSLHNVGVTLRELGRVQEAMPLLEQAVAVTRKAFGPDHPELEGSLWDLANVYRLLDRHAQALPVCQEVLDIALGRPNPSLSQASQVPCISIKEA